MDGTPGGRSRATKPRRAGQRGPVMIIGGAEDKLKDKVILARFAKFARGPEANVVVISTASSMGDQATELYALLFTGLGIPSVAGLRPLSRAEANDATAAALVERATGIFLTGGNQLRLSMVLDGTALGRAIVAARDRGAVVAGTSAGASAVTTHMIAFGASGATPKHRMAQLARGLGLLDGLVVDQHFEQRTRLGRLLAVVAQSPSLLGLGLDEDTAAVAYDDGRLEVIGRGAVTIVDGSNVVTDAFETRAHRPMMISGVILHSLPSGSWFDLSSRTLMAKSISHLDRGRRAEAAPDRGGPPGRRVARLARAVAAEGADSFVVDRKRRREAGEVVQPLPRHEEEASE